MTLLAQRATARSSNSAVDELWFTRCPVPTTFGIALQLGWLQEEFPRDAGVRFRALQESKDPKVLQSHYTHTQQNSFRHGGNYPAIYAQATGANTRVIGLSFLHASQTILTLPESPVRTLKDLKGRRLLVSRRPHEAIDHAYLSALRTYETALATVGLSLADVEIVEHIVHSSYIDDRLVQKTSADAPEPTVQKSSTGSWRHTLYPLVRGEVDAIASGGTSSLLFQAQGELRVIFDLGLLPVELQANNNFPLVFAVNDELLASSPDLVERVLKRALQAECLAREKPDEALHRLAVELAQPERLIRQVYGPTLDALLTIDFDPCKIAALKSQVQFMFDKGAIAAPVDVDRWLAPDLLERVRRLSA